MISDQKEKEKRTIKFKKPNHLPIYYLDGKWWRLNVDNCRHGTIQGGGGFVSKERTLLAFWDFQRPKFWGNESLIGIAWESGKDGLIRFPSGKARNRLDPHVLPAPYFQNWSTYVVELLLWQNDTCHIMYQMKAIISSSA